MILICLINGGNIVLDSNSYILFRRSSQSVTNIRSGLFKRLKNEIYWITRNNQVRSTIASFLLKYYDIKCIQDYEMLTCISNYHTNLLAKRKLIFSDYINTGIRSFDVLNKLSVIFGTY